MELDAIDKLAAKAFEGYIVRKDLVRKFKGQYPVPTYVAEFLLGRYCSSTDEKEIEEGLQIVQRQLADRTVRSANCRCTTCNPSSISFSSVEEQYRPSRNSAT